MKMLALAALLLLGSGQQIATPPLKVPASVMGKQLLSYVQPVYPESAKAAQVEGTVTLDGIIDERGKVRSLTVVSGPEQLRQGTLDAVAKWVYDPYMQDGKPIAVETTILVNYSLGPRRVARVPPAGGSTYPAQAAASAAAPSPQNGPCG
jgi:TonB family protein